MIWNLFRVLQVPAVGHMEDWCECAEMIREVL